MFKRRTLFVLGAGASAEVDFPVGTALAGAIKTKMDIRFEGFNKNIGSGDLDLFIQLTSQFQKFTNEYQEAAWLLRDGLGLAQSIDDFLDNHRQNTMVNHYGKAAIVKTILQAEHGSSLYFDPSSRQTFNPDRLTNTWFVKLMFALSRGIPKEQVDTIFDNIAFIIFNYDRCLEHFLLNALQSLYGIHHQHAADILGKLRIIHPYGAVDRRATFGATRANYAEFAGGIKTYTEQIEETGIKTEITKELENTECIIFLGFAFHAQNIRMLRPKNRFASRPIFATAYGMSDADVDVVSNQLADFFKGTMTKATRDTAIRLENKLKCAGLFDYYAKSLTGGD